MYMILIGVGTRGGLKEGLGPLNFFFLVKIDIYKIDTQKPGEHFL